LALIGLPPIGANLSGSSFARPSVIGKSASDDWNFQATGRIGHLDANVHMGNSDFSGLYSSAGQNACLREVGIGKCMKSVSSYFHPRRGILRDH